MKRLWSSILVIAFLTIFTPIISLLPIQTLQASSFTYPKFKAFDTDGIPLNGGLLYTYKTGTTTAKTTYTDRTMTTAAANPVVLDASGEASIYGKGQYRLVLKTADGATTLWTLDNVSGLGSSSFTNISDYGDMASAIIGIGSTPTHLLIDQTVTLTANTVVPSTLDIQIVKGGSIVLGAYTLTTNGLLQNDGTISGTGAITTNGTYRGDGTLNTSGVITINGPHFVEGYAFTNKVPVFPHGGTIVPENFGAIANDGLDDAVALKKAVGTGLHIVLNGLYHTTQELLLINVGQTIDGYGGGWGTYPADKYVPKCGIVALEPVTSQRYVKTRRQYRASALDSQDAALSSVINVQAEGVQLRNFVVYLDCDYTNTASTNLGADWDVGVLNSRGGFRSENLHIIGYFRIASFYQDTTRSSALPEFTAPDGTVYPDGTLASGSDNIYHVGALWTGGRWGEFHAGAIPCVEAVAAAGTITLTGIPSADETFVIGTQTFTFKAARSTTGQVTIGADAEACMNNIVTAVNLDASATVVALAVGTSTVRITAATAGEAGNSIVFTETATNVFVNGSGTLGTTVEGWAGSVSCSGEYYDEILEDTATDSRGNSGSSDYSHKNGTITSALHVSNYRWTDPAAVNPLVWASYKYETLSSGAVYKDGQTSLSANRLTKQTYDTMRYVSKEPFIFRCDRVGNIRLTNSHWEYGGVTVIPAAGGATVSANDLVNYGYGPVSITKYSGSVDILAPSTNLPADAWFKNVKQSIGACYKRVSGSDTGQDYVSSGRSNRIPTYQADLQGLMLFKYDGDGVQGRNFQRFEVTLVKDTAEYIDVGEIVYSGLGFVSTNLSTGPQVMFSFRSAGGSTDYIQDLASTGDVEYDNNVLTGTDGNDAHLTLAVVPNLNHAGRIYVENRLGTAGGSRLFIITIIK